MSFIQYLYNLLFFFTFLKINFFFIFREETGHSIDLKANVDGQKEMVFQNQESGMVRLVLGRSSVVGVVVRSRRIIGDVTAVAERTRTVGASGGVNTRVTPLQRFSRCVYLRNETHLF